MENTELTTQELEEKLTQNISPKEQKEIISLFNNNMIKKEVLRRNKLNNIQDRVLDNINERIFLEPESFSNKELVECYKVLQDASTKSTRTIEGDLAPIVQINQVNIDNNSKVLDRDSRERITDTISKLLLSNNATFIEEDEDVVNIDDYTEEEDFDTI